MKSCDEEAMKTLFIANDPLDGTERVYNALRLTHVIGKIEPSMRVTAFLMADAVPAGKAHQKTPDGYQVRHRSRAYRTRAHGFQMLNAGLTLPLKLHPRFSGFFQSFPLASPSTQCRKRRQALASIIANGETGTWSK